MYHKLMHDFFLRYNELFQQDQIMRAMYLSTGNFDAASELLDKYFTYDDLSPNSRNVTFTPHEDKELRKGHHKIEGHSADAIEDRLLFLG